VKRPKITTFKGGKDPKASRAARAGVAISIRPWGVLDRAKKSFNLEDIEILEIGAVFIVFIISV
jgi:hypothetical protein